MNNMVVQNAEVVNPYKCSEHYSFQILILRDDQDGINYIGPQERRALVDMLNEITNDIYREGVENGHFRPKGEKS